ncbi:hypothetical protein G6F46_012008 [Rhizopus delemar]|nr:hypothetical protein G6F46_012008 [Rhizopus delemar]
MFVSFHLIEICLFVNGEIEVVYNWKHKNHDPANPQEYAIESRLSPEIKKWIKDAVEKFSDWKSIKALLRLSEHELDVLETNPIYNRFPPALLINYHDVQNVISRRLNLLSRKRHQDSLSVQLWISKQKNGALTPPIKPVLLSTTPMIHATYLPLRQPILVQWLRWLVDVSGGSLPVTRIMVDCSATEIAAISEVFVDALSSLTLESNAARSSVRSFLNDLMYSLEEADYNKLYIDFNNKFKADFPEFTDYYETHWHNKRRLRARPWRKDGTFNTNNLIESYHNQLKSCYFGRRKNCRVDRVVYLLSQVVINDYRQDALRVHLGTKNLFLSKIEKERKEKAESIDIDEAISMITLDNDNKFFLFFALPSLPPMSFILFMLKTIALPPALAHTKLDCVNTSFLCLG